MKNSNKQSILANNHKKYKSLNLKNSFYPTKFLESLESIRFRGFVPCAPQNEWKYFLYFCKTDGFYGITAGPKYINHINNFITFKYNYNKKYHKTQNLKTSFLPHKISRIQKLPGASSPGPPIRTLPQTLQGPKTPCLYLAPL